MANITQFSIKIRSESHDMPEANFSIGFIIYHTRKNKLGISEPFVSAIEIASLKLSVNNRKIGRAHV